MRQRRLIGAALVAAVVGVTGACSAGAAGEGASAPAGPTAATLVGTYWRLVELPGQSPGPAGGRPAPYLTLQAGPPVTVSGHSGCNRLGGPVTVSGDTLRFGALVGTKVACAEGMGLEAAFFAALEATRGFGIEGQRLTLLDGGGRVVASFEADLLR